MPETRRFVSGIPLLALSIALALSACRQAPVSVETTSTPASPPQPSLKENRIEPTPAPTPTPTAPSAYRIGAFFGSGSAGSDGDNGPATEARIYKPSGMALGADQRIYVSDYGLYMVRTVDLSNGFAYHVLGTNEPKDASESVKAEISPVAQPDGLAFDSKGRLFVAQYGFPGGVPGKIRYIDALGNYFTYAGGGTEPVSDGADPRAVSLSNPTGLAFSADGTLFVAEYGGHRILSIKDGRMGIVAGTGQQGYGGDGGPAAHAILNSPHALCFDPVGRLVFADEGNHRIRRIESDGTVTTIAGAGTAGFSGDGGQAVQAQLYGPGAIAYDPWGNLIIADSMNNCVRRVGRDGVIRTIAGQGGAAYGDSGDGGPATEAMLDYPYGLLVDQDGVIYVSDRGNHRVRVLSP